MASELEDRQLSGGVFQLPLKTRHLCQPGGGLSPLCLEREEPGFLLAPTLEQGSRVDLRRLVDDVEEGIWFAR